MYFPPCMDLVAPEPEEDLTKYILHAYSTISPVPLSRKMSDGKETERPPDKLRLCGSKASSGSVIQKIKKGQSRVPQSNTGYETHLLFPLPFPNFRN